MMFQTAFDTQIARSLLSNGFVFGVFVVLKRKEPITAGTILRVIGSASMRLALG